MTAFLALSVAILAVQVVDVCCTAYAVRKYGLSERNPLWKALSKDPDGFLAVSTMAHVALLVVLFVLKCPAWALAAGLSYRVFVLLRNFCIIGAEKAKRRTVK
jgi:hypothetical protein